MRFYQKRMRVGNQRLMNFSKRVDEFFSREQDTEFFYLLPRLKQRIVKSIHLLMRMIETHLHYVDHYRLFFGSLLSIFMVWACIFYSDPVRIHFQELGHLHCIDES